MLSPEPKPGNEYYGHFATMSRLIGTLVSEKMIPAYYYPLKNPNSKSPHSKMIKGFCIGLHNPELSTSVQLTNVESLYFIVALREAPDLDSKHYIKSDNARYHKIAFLHPWEIMPYVYGPTISDLSFDPPDAPKLDASFLQGEDYVRLEAVRAICTVGASVVDSCLLSSGYDPTRLWRQYVYKNNFSARVADMVSFWLRNSSQFQTHIYNNPGPLPTLTSNPIHWEHSVMEGHPLFAISRTVRAVHPVQQLIPSDYGQLMQNTKIRLAAISRDSMTLNGDFEAHTRHLVDAILESNGNAKDLREEYKDRVFIPVHQLQVPNIREKINDAIILPEENSVLAYGLSSIRTVAVPGVIDGHTLKLSLGVELATIMRTIPPAAALYGYLFSKNIVPNLSYDRDILTIQKEIVSASYRHQDPEIAKHCCCIIRESVEIRTTSTMDGFAVCASLVEKIQRPDTTETLVTHAWKLDTIQKRADFLDSYIELFFKSIIPPCRDNGVAFEFHAQNTILRFDKISGKLKGFLIRDLCDMKVHCKTLTETSKVDCTDLVPPESYNYGATLGSVYIFLYYGAIYIHLQTLIRVLGMHKNGRGWAMARKHFKTLVPKNTPMYHFFMEEDELPVRSYTRTRIQSSSVNSADFDIEFLPNLLRIGLNEEEA